MQAIAVVLGARPAEYRLEPTAGAEAILRGFQSGGRRVVICKGPLDMADLIIAGARVTGPCRVTVAAWELDVDQIRALGAAVKDGRFLELHLLAEPGERGHEATETATKAFRVSYSATHAKVATLEAPGWSLAIRGSANMRKQRVIEQVEIEDSPEDLRGMEELRRAPQIRGKVPGEEAPTRGRAALAQLPPGGRLFGITSGFSTVNLLGAALERVGPAEVEIVGYKVAPKFAGAIAAHPNVEALRVLVSPAFVAKDPGEAAQLEELLGAERARLAWTHGRWFVVRGGRRAVVIHSSANLNANLRAEQYDASEEPATVAFFSSFHAMIWGRSPPGLKTPRARCVEILRGLMRPQNGTDDGSKGFLGARGLDAPLDLPLLDDERWPPLLLPPPPPPPRPLYPPPRPPPEPPMLIVPEIPITMGAAYHADPPLGLEAYASDLPLGL